MRRLPEQLTYSAVIDLDGVMFDFIGDFEKRFGHDHPEEVNLVTRYPNRKEEIMAYVKDPKTYQRLWALPVGLEIARYLFDRRDTFINIVTSRPIGTREVTLRRLHELGVRYDHFALIPSDKMAFINAIEPDMVIDDIIGVLNAVKAPLKILVAWPYNETPFYPRITKSEQFIHLWQRFVDENVPSHSRRVGMAQNLPRSP